MAFHPVLPHGLVSHREKGDLNFGDKVFGNNTLKMGVVLEIIEEDSKDNVVKLGPEYHVMVIEQDKNNGSNTSIYKNCMAIDSFGGVSDFFQMKYKAPTDMEKVKNSGSVKNQTGSIVLLLCLDGNAEKAVILGSIAHPGRKTYLTKEAGHHMEGEFNGIRYKIDKDGALLITQKTKTDNNGKPIATTNAGSSISIDKEGNIELNDATLSAELSKGNTKPKEKEEEAAAEEESAEGVQYEKIKIDRIAKKIQIEARDNIEVTTDKNLLVKTKENAELELMKDLVLMAEGKADITVKSMIDIKTEGKLNVKALDYLLTLDNSMFMKMTSFIMQAETAVLNNQQTIIGPSPQPAIILNTQTLSIGNLGAPAIGTFIGPFSSTVLISS